MITLIGSREKLNTNNVCTNTLSSKTSEYVRSIKNGILSFSSM